MLKEAHHHDIRFAGKKRVSEDLIKKKKKGFARKEEKKDERIATLTSPWDLAWLSVYVQNRDSDRE